MSTATADTDLVTTEFANGLSCQIPAASPLARALRRARTWVGPDAKARLAILRGAKSIAIVGASDKMNRASFFVETYLTQSTDFRLYFVNPNLTTILGRPVYPSLADLPEVPDIVDVFRKPQDLKSVIDEAEAIGATTVWMQLGIWNEEAARYGESKGMTIVMDRCVKVEHARFHGGLHLFGFDTGQISSHKAMR
ncbi:MAG TPA: CoA-binding protein [Microbacteriaceae bacterium]|nr:CoA-binding protein [Microbacteriaceae bacterium]